MVAQMNLHTYSEAEGQGSSGCKGSCISQVVMPLSHSLEPSGAPFCGSTTWRAMVHALELSPPPRQGCGTWWSIPRAAP